MIQGKLFATILDYGPIIQGLLLVAASLTSCYRSSHLRLSSVMRKIFAFHEGEAPRDINMLSECIDHSRALQPMAIILDPGSNCAWNLFIAIFQSFDVSPWSKWSPRSIFGQNSAQAIQESDNRGSFRSFYKSRWKRSKIRKHVRKHLNLW